MRDAIVYQQNYSGFSGYHLSDIYPNLGYAPQSVTAANQDAAEQAQTTPIDQADLSQINSKRKGVSIGAIVIGAIALVIIAGAVK